MATKKTKNKNQPNGPSPAEQEAFAYLEAWLSALSTMMVTGPETALPRLRNADAQSKTDE